jgi:hypothetical protein
MRQLKPSGMGDGEVIGEIEINYVRDHIPDSFSFRKIYSFLLLVLHQW